MAEKRMFTKSIVLSDDFLDMPMSTRCLYFTLGMLADDDGFINSPKAILRQCGASLDDMRILIAKKYLLEFDTGVIVIRHWRLNNYLRSDRYTQTSCISELEQIATDKSGAYFKIDLVEALPDGKNAYDAFDEIPESVQAEIPEAEETKEIEAIEETSEVERKPEKKPAAEKKKPLAEREPVNDIERVEKEYLRNYSQLHGLGIIRMEKPIINWTASRKMTKDAIRKYGVGVVLEAVRKSMNSRFCITKGYTLTTILSAGVLAGLVNVEKPPGRTALADAVSDDSLKNITF